MWLLTGYHTLAETENAVRAKLGGIPLLWERMEAVANLHRAATAVRLHFENSVLRTAGLTWTAFVVLWVVWIFGEKETRHVAAESGITKGTLTGVMKTLEAHGLVTRRKHPVDGRLVLLALTPEGERLMRELFPEFNQEEAFVTDRLSPAECTQLAASLREIVKQLEEKGEERRQAVATREG
ncbi:MarR family winged helix-turn-helix transcriptional regulator [Amycolatopsis orientalis]|uniref:MarR family winged helix-turn-helix transcriptional regulator n=1 Tax=Amycolatopsis orientalis TaxID=31958 RepID=UPI000B1EE096|nr:MarR family winged helix-turn-helix transcriptional regulator [Amycolatopsis orientalis]